MLRKYARPLGFEDNTHAEREFLSPNNQDEQTGARQASFLLAQGLRADHRYLDLGGNRLEAAAKIIPRLNHGNYFAIASTAVISAGRKKLAARNLSVRVPAGNLRASESINVQGFPLFDIGMAHEVFTYLPLSYLSKCLSAIKPNFYCGRFYATFRMSEAASSEKRHWKLDVMKDAANDTYRVTSADIAAAAARVGWTMNWIAEWSHHRDQHVAEFVVNVKLDPSRVLRFPTCLTRPDPI